MNANFSLPAVPADFSEVATICSASEIEIGGHTVFGIPDARDLHAGLKVGRDYTNWIKGRIAKYGFREGVDYEKIVENQAHQNGRAMKSMTYEGAQVAHLYRLSLDMAKELAMVENNDQGRLVRRYFIWADDQRRQIMSAASAPLALDDATKTIIGGIVKKVVHAQLAEQGKVQEEQSRALAVMAEQVTALVAIVQPSVPGVVIRHGRTAGAILKANGFTKCPRGTVVIVSNWLAANGCQVEGRVDTGMCRAKLFDPDKAEAWFKNGGAAAVARVVAEKNGQGALALSGPRHAPAIPPDMDSDGIGAVMIKGSPVYFDIRVKKLEPDTRYVVINVKGDVLVDIPHCSMVGRGGTLGPRGVLTSPQMEAVPGRHDPMPVQWEGVILGKVLERNNVVRLPA